MQVSSCSFWVCQGSLNGDSSTPYTPFGPRDSGSQDLIQGPGGPGTFMLRRCGRRTLGSWVPQDANPRLQIGFRFHHTDSKRLQMHATAMSPHRPGLLPSETLRPQLRKDT